MHRLAFFLLTVILGESAPVWEEIYGPLVHVAKMMPRERRNKSEKFYKVRTEDNCVFPIDVVIVQDATSSFQDDIRQMKNVQLREMIKALKFSHPGSRYAAVSFRDKPIAPLGNTGDYCFREEAELGENLGHLESAYAKLKASGGGDPPENQFGAMLAALQSPTIGWDDNEATRLIVLSTDAPPHFVGDGLTPVGLTPFTGTIDFTNPAEQCVKEGYPSPGLVLSQLMAKEAYAAFLVFDADYQNGLVGRAWQYFNSLLQQGPEFINPLAEDSSDFWEKLSVTIQQLEKLECQPLSTSTDAPTVTLHPDTRPPTSTEKMPTSTQITEAETQSATKSRLPTTPSAATDAAPMTTDGVLMTTNGASTTTNGASTTTDAAQITTSRTLPVCPEKACLSYSGVVVEYVGDLSFLNLKVDGESYDASKGSSCYCP